MLSSVDKGQRRDAMCRPNQFRQSGAIRRVLPSQSGESHRKTAWNVGGAQVRLCAVSGKRGQLGASANLSKSPNRQARDRARRKREEKRWERKSGPVTTRFICPICGGTHS